MADLSESQRKRADARKRRRKQSDDSGPGEASDGAQRSNDGQQQHQAVRQAAKVAAAVGAAGAAAAAARALTSHDDDGPPPREQPQPEHDEPQSEEARVPELEQDPEPEAWPESEREELREPVAGASERAARRALDRGRQELEDLLGRSVESVSAFERTHDGWVLSLEVVEVNRVPETMDVLASYELELDDDLNLRRYERARRYHRSRADIVEDV